MSSFLETAKNAWCHYLTGTSRTRMDAAREFDTEMADMIRTAKAEAWREGAESAFFDPDIRGYVDYPNNPYK